MYQYVDMPTSQMIYVPDSHETFWERARIKAGEGGLSRYVNRLVRADIMKAQGDTCEAKLVEASRLIAEVTDDLTKLTGKP